VPSTSASTSSWIQRKEGSEEMNGKRLTSPRSIMDSERGIGS
jgi:hypothetical protein